MKFIFIALLICLVAVYNSEAFFGSLLGRGGEGEGGGILLGNLLKPITSLLGKKK